MSLKELLFRKHDERIRKHERTRFRAYIRGEVFGGCMEPDRDCHWCEYMSLSADIDDYILREAKAEAWDEGARWAAVECRALETEGEPWLTPSDNPYREETE